MPILSFTIRDKVMDHVKGNPYYVCGNSDYVVKLDMDNEWGFALFTAVIKWYDRDGIGHKITKEFVGDSFEFPLIYDATRAEIGIYAGDKHTTTPGIVACRSSILTGELPEEPPTEDVYTQIIALIEAGAVKGKSPYIGEDNHWFEWDTDTNQYVDTGIRADYVLTDEDKEEIKEGAIQDIYDDIRSPLAAAEAARDAAISAKDSATASATSAMASSASAIVSANIADQRATVATTASETATNAKNVAVAAKESASASAAAASASEANVSTMEASVRTMQQFVAGVGVEVLDASQAVRADKNAAQAAAQAAESAATRAETAAEGLDEHIAQIQQNKEDIARHETAIDDLETLTAGHTETLATHTTEIDSLETRMTTAETDIADHEEAIADNTENIEAHEKRLDNDERQIQILFDLTQGQVWDVQEDDTEAYQKTVLSGSRLGEVNKIGGRSIVDNQLYPLGTASIPTVSGNKFLKKLKGVESVVTADGNPIAMGENGTSPSAKFAIPFGHANSRIDMLGGRSFKWNQIVNHDQSIPNSITGPNSMPITNVGNVYTGTRADSNNSIGFGRIISDRIIGNHVYYFSCDLKATSSAASIYARFSYSALIEPHQIAYTPGIWTRLQTVRKAVASPIDTYLSIYVDVGGDAQIGDTFEFDKDSYITIDLTEVFGAGNEPMTAAAAVTALEKLGIDITQPQPYDPGSIKHTAVDSVKWSGRNLLPNVWHQGSLSNSTGAVVPQSSPDHNAYTDPIFDVVASEKYYAYTPAGNPNFMYCYCYDVNGNYLGRSVPGYIQNKSFEVLPSTSYVRFMYFKTPDDFNVDDLSPACINKSDELDGTYSPYIPPVTQQVPAAVKALPGYGWGVGTAFNHIERVGNKWQYVQEVSKLTLAIDDMDNTEDYPGWKNSGVREIVGDELNIPITHLWRLRYPAFANTRGANDVLFMQAGASMTQTEWKTQHAGESYDIYIKRATPIVTDITEMMYGAMEPIQLTEGMVTTYVHSDSGAEVPHAISFYSNTDYLINLTRIFGAGKEPTTPADFHAILPGYDTSYNAGSIRHTAVDKVVWRGKNLCRPSGTFPSTLYGITVTRNADGSVSYTGTADGHYVFFEVGRVSFKAGVSYYIYGKYHRLIDVSTGTRKVITAANHFVADKDYDDAIYEVALSNTGTYNDTTYPQVEIGDEFTSYMPYVSPVTQPLPSAVLALPGYGWSAGTAYNHIERTETGWQYVQEVGAYRLGDYNWVRSGTMNIDNWRYAAPAPGLALPPNAQTACDCVSARYPAQTGDGTYQLKPGVSVSRLASTFYIYDAELDGVTPAEYKEAVADIIVYARLSTPIVTDITSLMEDALDSVDTETGGSVTFENTNGSDFRMPVPNTTEYIVKLSEARS